ncbi:alkylhydroperoxidase [Pseudoroseomonas deserti]|uniref:Alkylhydroperoxidase n=1 Tax=Teichococcus deserti TaxID=1817963 RepID=A0A1V2H0A2_9PROT|nr:carboxymuconolactone decarboxylase family protein [Pseudoroseomonas deserti]ONG51790.1 alkylhydroperoxidase [Pseudoroseomonas deserti]
MERMDYAAAAPAGVKALGAVYGYVQQCGLPAQLVELVYLRISLLNGCAYCIDKHSRDLLQRGLAPAALAMVPAWREAGTLLDAREKAALAWAETVTLVGQTQVPEADYAAAASVFSDKELADLTIAIGLMNAFNRLAISFRKTPDSARG